MACSTNLYIRAAGLALLVGLSACTVTPSTRPSAVLAAEPAANTAGAANTATAPATEQSSQQSEEMAAFKAVLSGGAAVPPADTEGAGQLVAALNRTTGELRWRLNFRKLSGAVRGAYFGNAAAEDKKAVVLSIGRSVTSPYEGRALLTPAQRADLLAGRWYVNLRTARFPEGELRGPLIEQK